jgi:hypothetical protein
MAELIPRETKPEHREIHLRLLQMDVPAFSPDAPDARAALPTPVTVTVQDQSLLIRIDRTETCIELRAADIPRVTLNDWSSSDHTATIELRDPYEVVDHFNIVLGSADGYWIKAFGKMCSDKLAILVDSIDCPF